MYDCVCVSECAVIVSRQEVTPSVGAPGGHIQRPAWGHHLWDSEDKGGHGQIHVALPSPREDPPLPSSTCRAEGWIQSSRVGLPSEERAGSGPGESGTEVGTGRSVRVTSSPICLLHSVGFPGEGSGRRGRGQELHKPPAGLGRAPCKQPAVNSLDLLVSRKETGKHSGIRCLLGDGTLPWQPPR